jgi:hypothetical protein
MSASLDPVSGPWYRYGIVWLVLAPPVGAVLAGIVTFILILQHPDPVLSRAPAEPAHVSSSVMPPTD